LVIKKKRFGIFMSSSGSLDLHLAKLRKFSKLQLLKTQFQKIKIFHIKLQLGKLT
jgi:hypothetical protein